MHDFEKLGNIQDGGLSIEFIILCQLFEGILIILRGIELLQMLLLTIAILIIEKSPQFRFFI